MCGQINLRWTDLPATANVLTPSLEVTGMLLVSSRKLLVMLRDVVLVDETYLL